MNDRCNNAVMMMVLQVLVGLSRIVTTSAEAHSSFGLGGNSHALHHTDVASKAADFILQEERNEPTAKRRARTARERKRASATYKKKKKEAMEELSDGEVSTEEPPLTWEEDEQEESASSFCIPNFGDSSENDTGSHSDWYASANESPLFPHKLKKGTKRKKRRKKRNCGPNRSTDMSTEQPVRPLEEW